MSDTTAVTPDTVTDEDRDLSYAQAQSVATRQSRREMASRVKELRRQADGAKERARKAQSRFERAVAVLASEHPEREDWYEHPGPLPRKQLLEAAKLNTMALHRIMERIRKTARTPKRRAR